MMKENIYYVDRRGTNSMKWDAQKGMFGEEGLLALWVADMDFRVPQAVLDAEKAYLDTGAFGYYRPSKGYFEAFMDWERERHGYAVKQEWIRYAPGVVPAINWLVQIFTKPGDPILVLTPVYYPFLMAVRENERELVCCELINDAGRYGLNLAAFEAAILEKGVKCFILSSPHNPVGRVWKKEELKAMLDICKAHNVLVLSDEIHQDLTFDGHRHIPSAITGAYDDILITLTAASKTFNLAGCQNAFVLIPDEARRKAYDGFTSRMHFQGGTPFGYIAVEAAYRQGAAWLEQVKEIIWGNYAYAKAALEAALPKVCVSPLEGTYLMWVDFSEYLDPGQMECFFQKKCRLAVDYGAWFEGSAACHARFNLATSRENVQKAVEAILANLNGGE